ncbi:MAG: adenylosuccinate lyase [Candidatus Heimdallarchaeaceae archaeon]
MLEVSRYETSMKKVFSEQKKFELQLLVEKELAYANYKTGKIPETAYIIIKEKCSPSFVKLERVKEIEEKIHHDLMSVVLAISEQCGDEGGYIHLGATSYDIQDTVRGLQLLEAKELILESIIETMNISAGLASKYKNLACIGRTHGIHAVPTTYGMKFTNFLNELSLAKKTLENADVSFGKMSGAVGTYASFRTMEIEKIVLERLGLNRLPVTTQVVSRVVYSNYIYALGLIATVLDHFAREIRNLQRTEIDEVRESFIETQVGSSTMPQKRNPEKSERICGLARVIRGNIQTGLDNICLEHERDLTNSSSERVILAETSILTHYILLQMNGVLKSLHLNLDRIKTNLYLRKGAQCAENLMIELTSKMGRQKAHELLKQLSNEENFVEAVKNNAVIMKFFRVEDIDRILDPLSYIGLSSQVVEQALESLK